MERDKNNLAFGKKNYTACAISVGIIILGFALMLGPATSVEGGFEPDIFSARRIILAPMVCLFGFLLMIVAILLPNDKKTEQAEA